MHKKLNYRWLLLVLVGVTFLAGCQQGPQSCPEYSRVSLENPKRFAEDPDLPFQFPLEEPTRFTQMVQTYFAVCGQDTPNRRECHAAEDFRGDPGTPVYAVADGEITFSGPRGGYGWLIIIDHPQFNLYSLYGHLSPSRWEAQPGPVKKGELIGYLGDPDENGGTPEQPLIPHLHFGIRTGQRLDYPGSGEWRWMAGWIAACPQDLGWLQPTVVINQQTIPEGGFQKAAGNIFAVWWFLIIFGGIYLSGWVFVLIYASRRDKPQVLAIISVLYIAAGWIVYVKNPRLSYLLFGLSALSFVLGIYHQMKKGKHPVSPEG